MSRVLIITGMYRSATSLVASLIQRAGVDMGERLLGPGRDNPRGFFEDADFYEFHERALRTRGRTIFYAADFGFAPTLEETATAAALIQARQSKPLWGWKDPRTTLLLEFWSQILPEADFLLLYRHPYDVLYSLIRHADLLTNLMEAIEIWQDYSVRLINFYELNSRRCLLCHSYSVIDQPDRFASLAKSKFGLDLRLGAATRDAIYHPDELKRLALTSDFRLVFKQLCPSAVKSYDRLQSLADMPSGRHRSPADPSPDLAVIKQCLSALSKAQIANFAPGLLMILAAAIDSPGLSKSFVETRKRAADLEVGYSWLAEQRWSAMQQMGKMIRDRDEVIGMQAGLVEERWNAMQQMEKMIRERDEVIGAQAALNEERRSATRQMEKMIRERDEVIRTQAGLVEERWSAMQQMEKMIHERDEVIRTQAGLVEERWSAMQQMEKMIHERDKVVATQAGLVEERWSAMQQMEKMIRERDEVIGAQAGLVEERRSAMQQMEEMIRERDEAVATQAGLVEERCSAMQQMEKMIRERDQVIGTQAGLVEERWSAMQQMEKMIRERDEVLGAQAELVGERWSAMQQMEKMIRERDEVIGAQAELVEERWSAIQQMEKMIHERDEVIGAQAVLVDERWSAMQHMGKMIRERDEVVGAQAESIEERWTTIKAIEETAFELKRELDLTKSSTGYRLLKRLRLL